MNSNPESPDALPPAPVPVTSWTTVGFLFVMLILSYKNIFLTEKDWKDYVRMEFMRSFIGTFLSAPLMPDFKRMLSKKSPFRIPLVFSGIMSLTFFLLVLHDATKKSSTLVRSVCFLNFIVGNILIIRTSLQETRELETWVRCFRYFARIWFAFFTSSMPWGYFWLAFWLDSFLLWRRTRTSGSGGR